MDNLERWVLNDEHRACTLVGMDVVVVKIVFKCDGRGRRKRQRTNNDTNTSALEIERWQAKRDGGNIDTTAKSCPR